MIDRLLDVSNQLDLLGLLVVVVVAPVVGGFYVGRAVPTRVGMAIFGVGTAIVAFLAYRWYQSHVDYCKDSPEVAAGGDTLSCLEPGNWAAFNAANLLLALAELGLATMLAVGLVEWWKRRRSEGPRLFAEPS